MALTVQVGIAKKLDVSDPDPSYFIDFFKCKGFIFLFLLWRIWIGFVQKMGQKLKRDITRKGMFLLNKIVMLF